jgi:cytochrome c-type biogenesis protein CcmH/NrfG
VFDKSLELYRKAIKLAPDDFVLFSDYAETYYGTNPPRWKDGLEAWTEALNVAHDDVEREGVYVHLARINIKLGHFDDARVRLNGLTNEMYAHFKKILTRNLDQAIAAAATNSPAKPTDGK